MADYKKMYNKLFIEINDTIERLQKTLLEAEEIYIGSEETVLSIGEVVDKEEEE